MSDDRKDLPPANSPNFLARVREVLMVYLGSQGNLLDRGLTVRDLAEVGMVDLSKTYLAGQRSARPVAGVGAKVEDAYEADLTPPPTPTGFAVSAAISHVFIEHAASTYTQGHGHAKTVVYGATWVSGPLPTFGSAVKITEFTGTVFAHASNPATTWHLWIKWVTKDGVESVTPAGGTNGLVVTTGQDVTLLLQALNSKIMESQLYAALGSRINLIDGPDSLAGSVNARVKVETDVRAGETGHLGALYSVRVALTSGGKTVVGGFGLAGTSGGSAGATIDFGVRADKFWVGAPNDGSGLGDILPFVVNTVAVTVNGVSVPPGVYMDAAYIKNGTITNAKIGNAAIDDAKVANLSASKILAGSIAVGQYIQSTGYIAGSAGWRINGDGTAEFSGVIVRGTVYATAGQIGGNSIDASGMQSATYTAGASGWRLASNGTGQIGGLTVGTNYIQSNNYVAGSAGWKLGNDGTLEASSGTFRGALSGATGTFAGSLSAATGTFAGSLSAASGTFAGTLTAGAVNAVNTINIAGNAVTIGVSTFTTASMNLNSGALVWTTIATVSITSSGGRIFVSTSANVTDGVLINNPGPDQVESKVPTVYRLLRGGTEVALSSSPGFSVSEALAAGSYTYDMQAASNGSVTNVGSAAHRSMFALETKR